MRDVSLVFVLTAVLMFAAGSWTPVEAQFGVNCSTCEQDQYLEDGELKPAHRFSEAGEEGYECDPGGTGDDQHEGCHFNWFFGEGCDSHGTCFGGGEFQALVHEIDQLIRVIDSGSMDGELVASSALASRIQETPGLTFDQHQNILKLSSCDGELTREWHASVATASVLSTE